MRTVRFATLTLVALAAACSDQLAPRGMQNQGPATGAQLGILVDPAAPVAQRLVTFSTSDAESGIWSFGDGFGDEGAIVQHRYAAAGDYVVSYVVSDGRTARAAVSVAPLATKPDSVVGQQ